jgi:hypothetical protein
MRIVERKVSSVWRGKWASPFSQTSPFIIMAMEALTSLTSTTSLDLAEASTGAERQARHRPRPVQMSQRTRRVTCDLAMSPRGPAFRHSKLGGGDQYPETGRQIISC